MWIPALFATLLLGDPDPMASEERLADPGFESSALRSFCAATFADLTLPPDVLGNDKESGFSYTWAEAGYQATKLDAPDKTAHALFARGSIGFLNYFHAFVGVEREDTSFDNARVASYDVGGGVHLPLMKRLDVLGEVAWLYNYIDSDHLFDKDTNTGVSLYAGARLMVFDWSGGGVEVNGGYRYTDITSLLSDKVNNSIEIGARVHFLNHMSVGATYAFIEKDHALEVDFRFSF